MQRVNFKFYEYRMKTENVDFLDRPMKFVSELFGFPGYRETIEFNLDLEKPEFLLDRKSQFSVAGAVIGRKKAAEFKIKRWTYDINEDSQPEINVFLEEIKPTPLERLFNKFDEEKRVFAVAVTLIAVSLIIISSIYVVSSYPNPFVFWNFTGIYIRRIVGWTLFLTTPIFALWLFFKNRKVTFAREFIIVMGLLLTIIIPIIWGFVSEPPPGSNYEPIAYLDFLRSRFWSYIFLLISIAPWVTLFLKYFGFDLIASIWELVNKQKDKKS